MGRAAAELSGYGEHCTRDLSQLGCEHEGRGEPFVETAIIWHGRLQLP